MGASVAAATRRAVESKPEGLELVLFPGFATHDGRHANNSWLQETPDPITKMTWDNPVSVSVQDARALDIQEGDLVRVSLGELTLSLPAVIQPGRPRRAHPGPGLWPRSRGRGQRIGVNAYP